MNNMRSSPKFWRFLLLLTACLISLNLLEAANATNAKLTKVTLATSKNLWCSLALLANEQGYYTEEGLDVEVVYQDAGRYCLDALLSNSAELATIVETNIAYLGFNGSKNAEIIATLVESDSSAIIARKSRGISKPLDLMGKTIAISPGTTSDLFASRFILKNGLSMDQITIRKIQPKGIQSALIAKEVDAASSWEPFITNCLRALGDDAIIFRDPKAYTGTLNLAVRPDWATANPDTIRAFVRALKHAEDFVKKNPEQAKAILSRAINLDLQIVNETWSYYRMQVALDKGKLLSDLSSEGHLITTINEDFKGKPVPDYTSYVKEGFLEKP